MIERLIIIHCRMGYRGVVIDKDTNFSCSDMNLIQSTTPQMKRSQPRSDTNQKDPEWNVCETCVRQGGASCVGKKGQFFIK